MVIKGFPSYIFGFFRFVCAEMLGYILAWETRHFRRSYGSLPLNQ